MIKRITMILLKKKNMLLCQSMILMIKRIAVILTKEKEYVTMSNYDSQDKNKITAILVLNKDLLLSQ